MITLFFEPPDLNPPGEDLKRAPDYLSIVLFNHTGSIPAVLGFGHTLASSLVPCALAAELLSLPMLYLLIKWSRKSSPTMWPDVSKYFGDLLWNILQFSSPTFKKD